MGIPLLTTGTANKELITKEYVDTAITTLTNGAVAAKVSKAGDTMTGPLIVNAGPAALSLRAASADQTYMTFYTDTQAPTTRSAWFGYGSAGSSHMALTNEMTNGNIVLTTNGTGRVSVSADPVSALDVATKQYADTKAPAHTHPYLSSAGGTITGRLQIDTYEGLTLHYPGSSVVSLGAFFYGGGASYGLRVTNGWAGGSGSLAPLQIGAPVDGNSAATVDWVYGLGYWGSHGVHTAAAGTSVSTTSAGGDTYTWPGVAFSVPMVVNGDFGAMARAPHIHSWSNSNWFLTTNLNANAAVRLNWNVY